MKLFSDNIKIIRAGKTENIRGKIIVNPGEEIQIPGSIQPETNLKLIREMFGSHIEGAVKVYSSTRLLTKENGNGADIIEWDSRRWEVSESRAYHAVIPHYKSIAILIKDER